jgi:Spy/CpxP family protein refolding chaperone
MVQHTHQKQKMILQFRWLMICVALFIVTSTLKAQDDNDDKSDKFKAQKIGFITEKLSLTTKEAQQFWPIYNEYSEKKEAIAREKLRNSKYFKQNEQNMSDKEAIDLSDKYISLQKQEALLAEEYHSRFKAVLPAVKVVKLYQAEVQFKRELLKQLRQRK